MKRTLAVTIALTFVVLAGCSGASDPTSPDGAVIFTQVYKSTTSGVRSRHGEVITRQSRWTQVWDEITAGQSPKPALPAVDFEQRILVYAALGELGDSCADIELESIQRVNGALLVSVVERHRLATCPVCPPTTSQPVIVVAVPRAATDVSFSFRTSNTGACS
jgi:hypothetical protein